MSSNRDIRSTSPPRTPPHVSDKYLGGLTTRRTVSHSHQPQLHSFLPSQQEQRTPARRTGAKMPPPSGVVVRSDARARRGARQTERRREERNGGTEAFIRSFIGLARRRRPLRNLLHMEDEDEGARATPPKLQMSTMVSQK